MKLFIMILAVVLLSSPVLASTRLFNDVPASHFAYTEINWLADPDNGSIMVGDARGNFNPNRVLTKFEAAQIFAMAAGFRHISPLVPPEERDMLNRSFDMWRPMLTQLNTEYARWNRAFDREISFLLYKGILTSDEVANFVTVNAGQETVATFLRQDAIAWTVRMMGRQAHASALRMPHHTPFRDHTQIARGLQRYIYYAAEAGIIHGTGGYIRPLHAFTRAETAMLLFEVLETEEDAPTLPSSDSSVTTITGVIQSMIMGNQVNIISATGIENFRFARDAIIMVDNVQRSPAFLRDNMAVTAVIGENREILTIVGRTVAVATAPTDAPQAIPPASATPSATRTVQGVLVENHPFANNFILSIRDDQGNLHQFTTQPTTVFSRGNALGITWSDIIAGDMIVAEVRDNILVSITATPA